MTDFFEKFGPKSTRRFPPPPRAAGWGQKSLFWDRLGTLMTENIATTEHGINNQKEPRHLLVNGFPRHAPKFELLVHEQLRTVDEFFPTARP